MAGTVVRVFLNKGYGFVRGDDGVSRFFEAREVVPPIAFDRMREGQGVTFLPTQGPKDKGNGLRASQVMPCS